MTNTTQPRVILFLGAAHYTTDTGEQPGQLVETLCERKAMPEAGPAPRDATCEVCRRMVPALSNPYMGYSRDELAEAIEQIAQAIAAGGRLTPVDQLHAITEAEMEFAETRKRIVVTLFRTGPGKAGWGAGYWSWERIGNALGISRQAARKTYGPMVERAQIGDQIRNEQN